MKNGDFSFHYESTALLKASMSDAFEYLDDQKRLGSHMGKSSWMMAGSHMDFELDEKQGREVGSEIVLKGQMLGIPLFVKEIVQERTVPNRKVWQTVGPQKLIIIDQYRMGFELTPAGELISLRIFIDYSWPGRGITRLLAQLFSQFYAKWCTESMVKDATDHFNKIKKADLSYKTTVKFN